MSPFLSKPSEIKKLIKKLKTKKALGQDQIQNFILENLPFKTLVLITKLINVYILNSYFPKDWKITEVIAVINQVKIRWTLPAIVL